MKYVNIDNKISDISEDAILITGDFNKIKNDNRDYILHVSPATFMFLKFDRNLDLNKIKVCFDKTFNENNLFEFKRIIKPKRLDDNNLGHQCSQLFKRITKPRQLEGEVYFTLKTQKQNGYMLLDNNTNPFLCYRNFPNSMPMLGAEIWILVAQNDETDYQFTMEKQVSPEQIKFTKKGKTIKKRLFDDTYIYYNISGNKRKYKRVIFSFPSIAKPPVSFKFWNFSNRVSEGDLVIAFSDWYGNFGSYMMKNDKKEDISVYIREVIEELYNQYVKKDTQVVFTGISKGGWIANYFAQYFEVDQLWVTVPQMDIEHSFLDVIKLNSAYRLNLIYFFKDDDMSKYEQTKLNGKYNQYVFSDLDYPSDKDFGKTFEYDYAIIKRDKHNAVNLNTMQAWFPKGESKQTDLNIKMFKVNNNLNFNIKSPECSYAEEYRKYVSLISCKKTSLHAEMAYTVFNTFVSENRISSIFPEFIEYYNEPLKFEIYTKEHSYIGDIPAITLEAESQLPNFNICAYISNIQFDDENICFIYEIECDTLEKITNMHFVVRKIFYNKLPIGAKEVKIPKSALRYKKMELNIHLTIDGYEILLPFDFTRFNANNTLRKEAKFSIKDGWLLNLDM